MVPVKPDVSMTKNVVQLTPGEINVETEIIGFHLKYFHL